MNRTSMTAGVKPRARLLMAAVLTLAGCTGTSQSLLPDQQARELAIVDETSPIELTSGALDLGTIALREFKARNRNWKCFDVLMYSQDEYWRVDFVPSDDVQDAGDVLMVGVSKCGNGVSYILSREGKIVRLIHSR